MDFQVEKLFFKIEKKITKGIKALKIEDKPYGCGFWLFYCDYVVFRPPCFGYNIEFEDENDRWSPPEWEVDIVDSIYEKLEPIYEKITLLMQGKSDEEWEELIDFQWRFYTSFCSDLNINIKNESSPFKNWNTTEDFVIGVFETSENQETFVKLVIDSIGMEKAKKLCVI